MLYPKTNPVAKWIFKTYVKWAVKGHFHNFKFNTIDVDNKRSVLLIANHFGFWDGLILYCLNQKLLKKKFHVMILHDTAQKVSALRYGGAFSVQKGSRNMLQSISYATELLNEPDNLVLMFPQGKLYSNFVEKVEFEKGVQRIVNKAEGKFQLIFAATFVQYLKHKKPSVTVYLKTDPANYAGKPIAILQDAYQQHYQASKQVETEIEIE